jgi:PKD repeat protein
MVKEIDWWNDNPPTVSELTRICYDGLADFTSDIDSGSAPLTVNFTDQSCGIITSWSWDFGDGSASSEQNPSHTYTNPGTYTVSLTVSGPGGPDEKTKVDFISVSQRGTHKAMPFIPLLLTDD